MVVYRIQIKDHYYYGQTSCASKRKMEHLCGLRGGYHFNQHMQRAWDKHQDFSFEIVASVVGGCQDTLNALEQMYIDMHYDDSRCMNISRYVDSPTRGRKLSSEHRAKLSAAKQGEKHFLYGKKMPEAWRKNCSKAKMGSKNPMYGRDFSAEHRRKLGLANAGANNNNAKALRLKFPDGTSREYEFLNAASKDLGVPRNTLSRWLLGTTPWPGSGGPVWGKYKHLIGLTGYYLSDFEMNLSKEEGA